MFISEQLNLGLYFYFRVHLVFESLLRICQFYNISEPIILTRDFTESDTCVCDFSKDSYNFSFLLIHLLVSGSGECYLCS